MLHVGDKEDYECRCCCDNELAAVPVEFHRDVVTGAVPAAGSENVDAVVELWRNDNGDVAGLTQETVLINCTGTGTVATSTLNGPDGSPGFLSWTFADIEPTAEEFSAVQILWTETTFDAFAHVAHIASGSLKAVGTWRGRWFTEVPAVEGDWPAWVGPATERTWGVALRANGLLFLYGGAASSQLNWEGVADRCWHAHETSNLRVIDSSGDYRTATADEMRDAGLTVDAIATQQTHAVGVFVLLHREDVRSNYTGEIINPPAPETINATVDVDTVGIYANYRIDCQAAFVNLSTLTLSTPAHSGVSNCEPHELRGISATLTVGANPTWDAALHSEILKNMYGYGFAYTGSTTCATNQAGQGGTSETATVEIWYAPCRQLVMRVTVPSKTHDAWLTIDHTGEQTDDACVGNGDSANGHATSPTTAGHFQRDIRLPCQTAGTADRLAVPWYGSDCANRSNETTWANVHGIVGKCKIPMAGTTAPVCVTGLSPNQLPQITECYSLDPVAIGYRRRITNNFGYGSFGPCGSSNAPLDKSYPNNGETYSGTATDPLTATAGSSEITLDAPAHGLSAVIPGSPGIVSLAATAAATDFVLNSGHWTIPPGAIVGITAWKYKDPDTLKAFAENNGFGFAASTSGTGGGAVTFEATQFWGHDCKLHVLDDMGFGFGLGSVIGVGSALVAGYLYFDITE